jgi:DNA repair exonuclease SbcCD ATPase subunit
MPLFKSSLSEQAREDLLQHIFGTNERYAQIRKEAQEQVAEATEVKSRNDAYEQATGELQNALAVAVTEIKRLQNALDFAEAERDDAEQERAYAVSNLQLLRAALGRHVSPMPDSEPWYRSGSLLFPAKAFDRGPENELIVHRLRVEVKGDSHSTQAEADALAERLLLALNTPLLSELLRPLRELQQLDEGPEHVLIYSPHYSFGAGNYDLERVEDLLNPNPDDDPKWRDDLLFMYLPTKI